jgi:hypothetical protein
MVSEVRRIYEKALNEDHPEVIVNDLSHMEHLDIIGSPEETAPEGFRVRHSLVIGFPEATGFRLSHVGVRFITGHPESGPYNYLSEVNLCAGCPTPEARRIERRFSELVAEWRRGTGGLSSPRAIASHPAYQQIIRMGEAVLPLIFQELRDNGGWWYPALRALTGKNPVPDEAKGKPPLNRQAWLDWGQRNGHPQP